MWEFLFLKPQQYFYKVALAWLISSANDLVRPKNRGKSVHQAELISSQKLKTYSVRAN